MNTLTLSDDEARLLLAAATEYAHRKEFDIDRQAQQQAYGAWLLAGKIAELLDPPASEDG